MSDTSSKKMLAEAAALCRVAHLERVAQRAALGRIAVRVEHHVRAGGIGKVAQDAGVAVGGTQLVDGTKLDGAHGHALTHTGSGVPFSVSLVHMVHL